jgi:hypothetical protein
VRSSGGEQPEHRLGQAEAGSNVFEPLDQSCTPLQRVTVATTKIASNADLDVWFTADD